jgi:glycosyltransferase involved in cell wall biosynthesis
VITLAVPFYRGADYLARAIESALRQTDPRWQLVVADEGVDPDGPRVVERFADPRVRYLQNRTPLGLAGNWNRCLDAADTDLVTLLHADDELRLNYVALMAHLANSHPDAAALFCHADVIGPDGRPVLSVADRAKALFRPRGAGPIRVAGDAGLAALLRGNFVMCPTVCYRRSRLGQHRFDPRWRMVADLDLFARLLRDGMEMVGSREIGYAYRRHPGNATTELTDNLVRFREESALYDELAAAAAARGWAETARVARGRRIIKLHLMYRIVEDAARGRFPAAGRKLRFLAGGGR